MTDASGFFDYPTIAAPAKDEHRPTPPDPGPGFLEEVGELEWEALLSFTQTRYLRPGEVLLAEGDTDRALYLLTDGRVELSVANEPAGQVEAAAPLNLIAFLDRGVCAVTVIALVESEVLRLSFEAFESLASHEPVLARELLLDVGRIVAQTLRSA